MDETCTITVDDKDAMVRQWLGILDNGHYCSGCDCCNGCDYGYNVSGYNWHMDD